MFLGIEIGGTKLQLCVGTGKTRELVELERVAVRPEDGAQGVLDQIKAVGKRMIKRLGKRYEVKGIGIGFGGPIEPRTGRVITSHQVSGWNDFALAQWCEDTLGLPAVLANDSDAAGLAEAVLGAGRGQSVVYYTNAGSGIGGALLIDGKIYRGGMGSAIEPGHLRPGLQADRVDQTVESLASGWGITATVRAMLAEPISHPIEQLSNGRRHPAPESLRQRLIEREDSLERDAADLLGRCDGQPDNLNTKIIAEAALAGNEIARDVFLHAAGVFGWAVAQAVTLLSPNVVVVGGGVSLAGEDLWLKPLCEAVERYVFPPRKGGFKIVPAELDEEVVLHGALVLAAGRI
ncbi:MAG: ROK family protein [Planctomycetota bacterium]|nr:ROK family protein [Planctomycetota bacterium]